MYTFIQTDRHTHTHTHTHIHTHTHTHTHKYISGIAKGIGIQHGLVLCFLAKDVSMHVYNNALW